MRRTAAPGPDDALGHLDARRSGATVNYSEATRNAGSSRVAGSLDLTPPAHILAHAPEKGLGFFVDGRSRRQLSVVRRIEGLPLRSIEPNPATEAGFRLVCTRKSVFLRGKPHRSPEVGAAARLCLRRPRAVVTCAARCDTGDSCGPNAVSGGRANRFREDDLEKNCHRPSLSSRSGGRTCPGRVTWQFAGSHGRTHVARAETSPGAGLRRRGYCLSPAASLASPPP
jgi:hypothetical protein